ncbi:MAG: DUF2523 family protein [Acidithiobacillus sp.]|nr:DUF2523 family protein [Acidithiobacillus sp.]
MPAFLILLFQTVGTWLLKNILPQMLLSVGVGLVSFTGFSALSANLTAAVNAIGSGASSLDTLIHMFGIVNGLNIFLAAISIKVSLAVSKRVFPVRTS